MNRTHYISYIISRLSTLATEIEIRGKLNLLDVHLHTENFYLHFLNEIFGWELDNLNTTKHNVEAIDLIDVKNKIIVQVSATATKNKIESALSKDLSSYSGYTFKFISISKDASTLRVKTFLNPNNLDFTPQSDIYDVSSILKVISGLEINAQRSIFNLIKKELGSEPSPLKLESNLAAIMNILAGEDWSVEKTIKPIPFAIEEKIEYNGLVAARSIIDDYNIHNVRVDRIYSEFDKEGSNKSTSVIMAIRGDYLKYKRSVDNDDLFFKVIECVAERIQNSANYLVLPYEELELCVNILVVDAFIRCKIFENPQGYIDAAS